MSFIKALSFTSRLRLAVSLVTQIVQTGAVFGLFFVVFAGESLGHAAESTLELARLDSSQILQKSAGGQISQLEPIGECRDPLAGRQSVALGLNQRSVLILARSKDLPKMRKDKTVFEEAFRRSPVTKASLIIRETQHQREVVVGSLEGLYLFRGFKDELRVSGTLDEPGPDGVNLTKAINLELSARESNFSSFSGNQVFECRLTHPLLIRFEQD